MPKFGNSHGNISEMKDLLYCEFPLKIEKKRVDHAKRVGLGVRIETK